MTTSDQRARFEVWCLAWNRTWTPGVCGDGFDLTRGKNCHDDSGYQCGETRLHWDLWQAATLAAADAAYAREASYFDAAHGAHMTSSDAALACRALKGGIR